MEADPLGEWTWGNQHSKCPVWCWNSYKSLQVPCNMEFQPDLSLLSLQGLPLWHKSKTRTLWSSFLLLLDLFEWRCFQVLCPDELYCHCESLKVHSIFNKLFCRFQIPRRKAILWYNQTAPYYLSSSLKSSKSSEYHYTSQLFSWCYRIG